MFVKAIEHVAAFTKPIHTISRLYGETIVQPGAATLFFVNELGCAVTCKHVVDLISKRQAINEHYENFKAEKAVIGKNNKYQQRIKMLENKYQYTETTLIQIQEIFLGVTSDPTLQYRWINHPVYDLSILVFENFKNPIYQSFAKFKKEGSDLKQGKFLCRLGFPFPEFTNFRYNENTDVIEWTQSGLADTPRFPIEGMLTRHLSANNEIYGIEMSTPGLKGQSGGPLFDEQGIVCGMQFATNHLHLGFDLKNEEYLIGGRKIKINNQPFLHVGHCIHAEIIKRFLLENNIKFYSE
jgi:hypothetical protein